MCICRGQCRLFGLEPGDRISCYAGRWGELDVMNFKHPKENDEEKGRSENVHSYWMQVARSSATDIFGRKKSRLDQQVFYGAEELTIEMREVIKKMSEQLPETFLGFNVFLSTVMTILSNNLRPTVQAVSFFTLREMGQL